MEKFEELKEKFEGKIVTVEEFENIDNNCMVISNGCSGHYIGKIWYTAFLGNCANDEEFDFYM